LYKGKEKQERDIGQEKEKRGVRERRAGQKKENEKDIKKQERDIQ
jgi:hypothetical protein